jgi:hypothetical protein
LQFNLNAKYFNGLRYGYRLLLDMI